MLTLYTNAQDRHDFLWSVFTCLDAEPPGDIWIATAFFTWNEPIIRLANRGWRFKLLVRLRFPTSPQALRELLTVPGVLVRFVTTDSFHPKMYILCNRSVVIGSANLTGQGFHGNQEAAVEIQATHETYGESCAVFADWWAEARPLQEDDLDAYAVLFRRCERRHTEIVELERSFEKEHGRVEIRNINRGKKRKKAASELYLESYRRNYQSFLASFNELRGLYEGLGRRRYSEHELPFRLEIDSYLAWLRDKHAKGDSYKTAPERHGEALRAHVLPTIEEWLDGAKYRWGDEVVVPQSYPTITRVLGSSASIARAGWDDVVGALMAVHSFQSRFRFFDGGSETHIRVFKEKNELARVKTTLTYLLHGPGDSVERMAHCLFDPAYRLREFGRSAAPETFGWVNREEKPVRNARTTRSMKWLGFGVELLDD